MKQIAITVGDINGIGPEVALKAVYEFKWPSDVSFLLIGPEEIIRKQAYDMRIPVSRRLEFLDIETKTTWNPGSIRTNASRVADRAIRTAVKGCVVGKFDAMVTAPICKEGFHKADIKVPGHTEYLAELTKTKKYGMMLIGGGLRVTLVTRHMPLSEVAGVLTKKEILRHIELTGQALELFDIENGRIGVCGLNPHAGDGGVLGPEEKKLIRPAIRAARKKGLTVSDVVPADTIFYQAKSGEYDAVVAMYHDQGLGPLKMVGFEEGVNVTLGLPIVRTSPDHGTAFDLAGKSDANPTSMKNAIELAILMARRPNPWKG